MEPPEPERGVFRGPLRADGAQRDGVPERAGRVADVHASTDEYMLPRHRLRAGLGDIGLPYRALLHLLSFHTPTNSSQIKWSLDTLDYRYLTTDTIQQSKDIATNAFQSHTPYIVGMHDIHPLTVRNLTQAVIDAGRAAGYTFATVGECLGDPEENWYRDAETGEANV